MSYRDDRLEVLAEAIRSGMLTMHCEVPRRELTRDEQARRIAEYILAERLVDVEVAPLIPGRRVRIDRPAGMSDFGYVKEIKPDGTVVIHVDNGKGLYGVHPDQVTPLGGTRFIYTGKALMGAEE